MDYRRPAPPLQPADGPGTPQETYVAAKAAMYSPLLSGGGGLTPAQRFDEDPPRGFEREKGARGHPSVSVVHQLGRLEYRGWTWEVLALLVALGCQVAIVAILIVMHDQPLNRWTAAVSINAVVATLTTAAKSMTLLSVGACVSQLKWVYFKARSRVLVHLDVFEETSKGPLGAVKMFLGVRHWLPLLGATIVLLALAVDTFAQQIITFEPRDVPRNDPSVSFRITQNYSAHAQSNGIDVLQGVDLGSADDINMQGAVMRGLYAIHTLPQFNCSSKCSWPGSFTTLGFEATCQNVTQATVETRKCGDGGDGGEVFRLCNMTTPGNLSVATYMDPTNWQTTVDVATKALLHLNQPPYSPDFLQLAIYRVPNQYNQNDGIKDLVGEEAVECTLRLSAWEYTNPSTSGNNFATEKTRAIPLGDGSYEISTNEQSGANDFYTFPTLNDPSRKFTIRQQDWLAVIGYLMSPAFTGNITVGNLDSPANNGIRLPLAAGNMTATVESLASSMTEYIRSGPNSQMVTGQLVQSVLHVRVQVAWLALPLFVQFAAIALLCFTAIQSRQARGVPLWKSSSMALLFAYYDPRSASILTSKQRPADLHDFAGSVKAKID